MTSETTFRNLGILLILAAVTCGQAAAQNTAPVEKDGAGLPVISRSVTISEAVEIALNNNPSLASRKALVAAAKARVGMAKAMSRGQVAASVSGTVGDMPMILPGSPNVEPGIYNLTSDKPLLSKNVMAMYPLYTGGRIKGQINSAQFAHEASLHEVASTELDVKTEIKKACFQVLLAKKLIEAYQSRMDESKERVRIAEEAFNVGRIAKYDLLRNQTELADAQQQLNISQKNLEVAFIELRKMMGISQTSQLDVSQDLSLLSDTYSLADMQAEAMKNRPEIAAVQARISSARSGVEVAKSSYKPQVYATAMLNYSLSEKSDMGGGSEAGYLLGITASLPIFDGGLRHSSLQEAQAMLEQMRAEQSEVTQMITRDVAAAHIEFTVSTKNAQLSEAAIVQAEEDYRIIRLRYDSGKATNVEVLDALASLTRMKSMYAEALYEQNTSYEMLMRAIGRH